MQLRNYQERAVREIYGYLRTRSGNPCVVIPTGGGKTPVIATICKDAVQQWNGRVLIVAHVKELLEQSVEKLQAICPLVPVGVYSAGLGSRDTTHPVIVAGVQSVYEKAEELGRFDLLLIDEAHLISEKSEGRYRTLISGLIEVNPDIRIIGLTATPYRTGSGMICKRDGILNDVCYNVSVSELIARGFLSKLTSKAATHEIDTNNVKVVRGEFDEKELSDKFTLTGVVEAAVEEIVAKTKNRKSVLIFCQTIAHAERVAELLRWSCEDVREIYGDTKTDERRDNIRDFRNGLVKYLVNVNVLTTGFDAPNVDCVCLLRATVSPGLYYQMVGRGFRLCEGKTDCLILDFGENVKRHGPVDEIRPKIKGKEQEIEGKTCPQCSEVVGTASKICKVCGHEFEVEPHKPNHQGTSSTDSVTGEETIEEREVTQVTYKVHHKKDAAPDHPRTLRVTYCLANPVQFVSEWICVEHKGFARAKAERWWAGRAYGECPISAEDALDVSRTNGIQSPWKIKLKTKSGEKFPEIVGYTFRDPGEGMLEDMENTPTNFDDPALIPF
jgi:DNA repair protein RadD